MQLNSSDHVELSDWREFAARKVGLTGVLIILSILAVGCPGTKPAVTPPKDAKPYAGASLKIASTDAAALKAFGSRAAGWAGRTGAAVVEAPLAEADIVIVPPALVGAYTEKDDALAVPEDLMQSTEHPGQWMGILRLYRERLAAWGGVLRAVPLAGEAAVLVIRTDKMSVAALKEKYQAKFGRPLPALPTTWEDIAEIAEACQGLSFTAMPSSDTLANFFRIAACYDRPALGESDLAKVERQPGFSTAIISFTHVADTGEPRLNAPGFEAALKCTKRIWPSPAKAEDAVAALAAGRAACAVLSLAEVSRLPKDARGMVVANIAVAALPGTRTAFEPVTGKVVEMNSRVNYVPYCNGGWFGVVRKSCASPAAAFDLLADLANPARSLEILSDSTLGFGPVRGEHLEQSREMVWQRYGFDAARTHQLADAIRNSTGPGVVNPALGLRGPDAAELTAILAKALDAGDLKPAQAAWQQKDGKPWRRRAAGLP